MSVDVGIAWQIGIWDRISQIYLKEVDPRFEPVVDRLLARAALRSGERALDLGTGTGAVAGKAAAAVAPGGDVVAVDLSKEMCDLARRRASQLGDHAYRVEEGRAEAIPSADGSIDVLLACLSLMYSVDRAAAAREIARVLRPGGRFVASVWAAPDVCEIVRFQSTAGKFAPAPPVPGVGPGALADPQPFLAQLAEAGVIAKVETEVLGFEFPDFALAWEVLAGVTTAQLPAERQEEAKAAVRELMWPEPDRPRSFQNTTQFIVGERT